MICQKCKSEIESGSIFCPKCGEAVQMVPDYNILDDDFLYSMVDKKEDDSQNESESNLQQKENGIELGTKENDTNKSLIQHLKDPKNIKYVISTGVVTIFIIFSLVVMALII